MSLPELTHTGGPAAIMASPSSSLAAPSSSFAAPDAGGQVTWPASPYRPGHPARQAVGVARPGAAEHTRNPRVIDGEVTSSWFPRPILPILVSSGVMFATGLAALVQEAIR